VKNVNKSNQIFQSTFAVLLNSVTELVTQSLNVQTKWRYSPTVSHMHDNALHRVQQSSYPTVCNVKHNKISEQVAIAVLNAHVAAGFICT